MNPVPLVQEELANVQHILDTVPFGPGAEPSTFFLDIYKLTFPEIRHLGASEKTWDSFQLLAVNKLLKLAISFGNLVKTFSHERAQYEARQARERPVNIVPQSIDPFKDSFTTPTVLPVPPYYLSFAKNLYLILKNFDVGSTALNQGNSQGNGSIPGTQVSRSSHVSRGSTNDNDTASASGSQTSAGNLVNSPIRLNSRQLLIEKLEININLDALFTMKMTLRLLQNILGILLESLSNYPWSEEDAPVIRPSSEISSIFSSMSAASTGFDSICSMEDYAKFVSETVRRINGGVVNPFLNLLKEEVVKPSVLGGFQDLVNTI